MNLISLQRGGRFIECGGYDGETASPTIFFERYRGWTGLLIEADPGYYTQILGKQRNVYSINACLSTETFFTEVVKILYNDFILFINVLFFNYNINNSIKK